MDVPVRHPLSPTAPRAERSVVRDPHGSGAVRPFRSPAHPAGAPPLGPRGNRRPPRRRCVPGGTGHQVRRRADATAGGRGPAGRLVPGPPRTQNH